VTDIEIDISGSHIDGLTEVQIKKLRKKKNAPAYGNNNINALSNRFKKVNKECLQYISVLMIATFLFVDR
jgi:hypothetical protein